MTSGNLMHSLYGHRASRDPAFIVPGGASFSTGDVLAAIDRAAGALAACGVKPGDRVSVRVGKASRPYSWPMRASRPAPSSIP